MCKQSCTRVTYTWAFIKQKKPHFPLRAEFNVYISGPHTEEKGDINLRI